MVVMLVAAGPSHSTRAQTSESASKEAAGSGSAKSTKRADPADEQNALDSAAKALDGGKAEQAVQQISTLLSRARLQGRSMARALYIRGAAYHKQGKPAQAIADLTSALWLKGGLADSDRVAATTLRSEAYRQAGLNDLADADAKRAGRATGTATTATAAAVQTQPATRGAEPARSEAEPKAATAPKQSASGGVSGFFSNMFGGSPSTPSASASSSTPRPDPYRTTSPRQPSVGDAWSASVESKQAASAKEAVSVRQETAAVPAKEEVVLKPATAAAAAKPQGRYRLQVAAVRGHAEAQAVAVRLKKDYAAALAGREPQVDETVIGNMGTFYRVRIGPFADAGEPGTLCAKLRGIGLDCLIMAD